jgi:phosphoribosyl-dephospho-CoA transferase
MEEKTVSQKSNSNEVKGNMRNIFTSTTPLILTAFILGIVARILSRRVWKRLRGSHQENLQSLLQTQNWQIQNDLNVLADKQDQQITALQTLAQQFTPTQTETETDPNWDRLTLETV